MPSEQLQKYIIKNGKDKTSQENNWGENREKDENKNTICGKKGLFFFLFWYSSYSGLIKFFYPWHKYNSINMWTHYNLAWV